ncbi:MULTISPECIES: HAMP domain-containing sensor histidine kinase [unclassified Streptomyces]|uniref:sensor histidine kinase n=1 Tax=unclassified Streptomyces TaxID=2593676 RepID=UPI00035CDDD3|nr:HAMP domain-containing sensor histidine kinase [Streptomyces sp. BoleA5]MYX35745.1 HAMP domain-containing protein [Streptomyces sp. SID8377]
METPGRRRRLRWWPRSLYWRLALGFLAITTIGVAAADVYAARALAEGLRNRLDQQLASIRQDRLDELETSSDLEPAGATAVVLLTDAIGRVVQRESGAMVERAVIRLSGADLDRMATTGRAGAVGPAPMRAVVEKLPDGGFLVIAESTADDTATVHNLVVIEAASGAPLIAGVVLGALYFSRRTISPLKEITATARRFAAEGAPSQRVSAPVSTAEVEALADAFNAMLGRVDEEFNRRRKAEEQLRDFVGAASHELRTSLTAIGGYAQLVRFGALDDPARLDDAMRRVQNETRRMSVLVDELLLLARLDQGRPLECRPVDLAELCADAVADARVTAPDRPVTLVVEPGPHVVTGDPDRLRQVVTNLLANVVAHTAHDVPAEVRVGREGDEQIVDVVDGGPGIPEELRERVFERFFRAGGGPARPALRDGTPAPGSGLGLSIVAAIAAAHSGSVRVEASESGAWFRVRLPALTPA